MALPDLLPGRSSEPAAPPEPIKIPASVKSKLDRGRKEMLKDAPKRRLCVRFEKGDTYWYVNAKGGLASQPTVTNLADPSSKAPHRIRNTYNFIRPVVEAKVSAATQRVPGYETFASTSDQEDQGAASLSQKVATYGYDKWRLRKATIKTVKTALVQNEGFALPYFDPNVGPYNQVTDPETGLVEWVGEGDIKVITLSRNEVYWESGCEYEDSPWFATERARPIDDVKEIPGYLGGPLTSDASTSDIPTDKGNDNQVMVTEYYERPCPKYPKGQRLTIANGRLICPPEDYPLLDPKGKVLDEPLLHRLIYTHDPDADNDLGLVWQLIDAQRTIQDCWNKLLEYKNRGLNPQMKAAYGSLVSPPDDTPGAIRYYKPVGDHPPEWETPIRVPPELFQMLDKMQQDLRALGSDQQLEAQANVAAKTVVAVIEQTQARWQSFLGDLAEWHSRLMRHCLLLVQRYYTEERDIAIRGRFGWEPIKGFRGTDLLGQANVTVLPGSLIARTQQSVQNELSWIQANFPGYLSPEVAIAALHGGTAESLITSYELDVARVDRVIQAIVDGTVMELPTRIVPQTQPDPVTGEPVVSQMKVPGYMPSPQDSLPIWKHRFGDFMKTPEWERLPEPMQTVSNQVWQGIMWQESQQQQAAVDAQNAEAQAKGLANAAAPQEKGMPSPPAADAA